MKENSPYQCRSFSCSSGRKARRRPYIWAEDTYHAGAELDEEGADDGTEELGDPVEDAGEDGDLAAEGKAEGDGRVHVAAGDVGADGDRDEQPEPVAYRHGNQPGWVKGRAAAHLSCNY